MKARVKATGEIITVGPQRCSRIDPDYWTRLEHQAAIAAMQGMLSNPESELDETLPQILAGCAAKVAHALVEQLKEKEERK